MQAKGENRRGPVIVAGILLGLGLGGFVDGIVLHQILQWHHMVSSVRPPETISNIEVNMVWDGIFEAATWLMTVSGVVVLWQAGQRSDVLWSSNTFVGSMLAGWGFFNFVEGLIDHQILGIHHVKPGPNEFAWDIGFLVSGVVLVAIGWVMLRGEKRESTT